MWRCFAVNSPPPSPRTPSPKRVHLHKEAHFSVYVVGLASFPYFLFKKISGTLRVLRFLTLFPFDVTGLWRVWSPPSWSTDCILVSLCQVWLQGKAYRSMLRNISTLLLQKTFSCPIRSHEFSPVCTPCEADVSPQTHGTMVTALPAARRPLAVLLASTGTLSVCPYTPDIRVGGSQSCADMRYNLELLVYI